jgi:hypothetical protein
MSAAVRVPRHVVEHARKHFVRTGRPLLFAPRRKADWALAALPGESGRWLILLDPETPPAQVWMALADRCGGPLSDDAILERLAKGAIAALADVPRKFECEGHIVGVWEASEGSACVRGSVALTCLSWALRKRRVGFYLILSELGPD